MDVYKEKIQYNGSLEKLKLKILVIGDFQNKETIGDNWYTTALMITLNYCTGKIIQSIKNLSYIILVSKEKQTHCENVFI